jgi:hypothetical protein
MANSVNSYVNVSTGSSNAYSNVVGAAGNTYAASVGTNANNYANATFLKLTGGTISGDLSVTGNLNITGNTAFVNVTNYKVQDSLIYLADSNYATDVVEIGFVANYNNGACSTVHTGLYRAPSNKQYYLFQGYDKEPANNYINPTGNNITNAVLNADLITSNLWLGGVNAIPWISATYIVANAAFDKANSANVLAYSTGIGANGYAVTVGAASNVWANTVGTSGNNYAGAMVNTSVSSANNYAGVMANSANAYMLSSVGAANNYAGAMANSVNAYTSATYATTGTVSTGLTSANNYAGSMANAANAYAASLTPNLTPAFSAANQAGVIANAAFNKANNASGGATIGNTAPSGPANGALWWSNTYGRLLVYYNDGTSAQWVDASPSYDPSPIYNVSNAAFTIANAAFGAANNVAPQVTPAFNTANAAFTIANAAFGAANNVAPQVTPAFNTANAAFTIANAAFGAANNVAPQVTPAFNTANAAFGKANTALQNTSGVSVAGDFYFPAGANVGIGTTDISYGGNVGPVMTINANAKTGLAIAYNATQLSFAINPQSNGSWIMYDRAGGGSANVWTVGIMQANGKVGIANTSPGYPLTVNGQGYFQVTGPNVTNTGTHLTLENANTTAGQSVQSFTFGGVAKASIRADYVGNLILNANSTNYWFGGDLGTSTANFYQSASKFMQATGTAVSIPGSLTAATYCNIDTNGITVRTGGGNYGLRIYPGGGTDTTAGIIQFTNAAQNSQWGSLYYTSTASGVGSDASIPFYLKTGGTNRAYIDTSGHLLPASSNTYDLGSSSARWRNIYTGDLHLANEFGNWTIVEGEDELFLYNNKKDKVYKFNLTEVDKSGAPPKKG